MVMRGGLRGICELLVWPTGKQAKQADAMLLGRWPPTYQRSAEQADAMLLGETV